MSDPETKVSCAPGCRFKSFSSQKLDDQQLKEYQQRKGRSHEVCRIKVNLISWIEMYDTRKCCLWWYAFRNCTSKNRGDHNGSESEQDLEYVTLEEPPEFESNLACQLMVSKLCDGSLQNLKCCKQKFKSRSALNQHRLGRDHDWVCCCCESTNCGLNYPVCALCGNYFDINGVDLKLAREKILRENSSDRKVRNNAMKTHISHEYFCHVKSSPTLSENKNGTNKKVNGNTEIYGSCKDGLLSGIVIIKWKNNDSFIGQFERGKRSGFGIWKGTNGKNFEGEFLSGLRHGYGEAHDPKAKYNGMWKNGKMENKGKITFSDGTIVKGMFKEGYLHGPCIISTSTGDIFKGRQYTQSHKPNNTLWILEYVTGECFRGTLNNRFERHGKGECTFSDGSTYKGMWKDGFPCGHGTRISQNGDKLYGIWKNGYPIDIRYFDVDNMQFSRTKISAELKLWLKGEKQNIPDNTGSYIGEWKNGMRHGKGVYIWAKTKSRYEGDFLANQAHGRGRLSICEGKILYFGSFQKNKFHGPGRMRFSDGSYFLGGFSSNMMRKGIRKYMNGETYTGHFLKNKKYGKGKLTFNDGSVYDGEFKADLKHGEGKFILSPNNPRLVEIYDGAWAKDQKHGTGYQVFALTKDEYSYHGKWRDDCFHGDGLLKYKDGRHYQGNFKEGKKDGYGIEFDKCDKVYYEGEYKGGYRHGKGKLYSNRESYEGTFLNGLRHGFGIVVLQSGSVFRGHWYKDKPDALKKGRYTIFASGGSSRSEQSNIGVPRRQARKSFTLPVFGF